MRKSKRISTLTAMGLAMMLGLTSCGKSETAATGGEGTAGEGSGGVLRPLR